MIAIERTVLAGTMLSLSLFVLSIPRAESQTAVTACEQAVRGDAYLANDLDCGPDVEAAVELEGGSLDMRGFTIHGGDYGVLCAVEIGESGDLEFYRYVACHVFGGGTISGQRIVGIVGRKLEISDVTIVSDSIAIHAHSRATVNDVSLQLGPLGVGFLGGPHVRLDGINLTTTGGDVVVASPSNVRLDGVNSTAYLDWARLCGHVGLAHAALGGGTRGIEAVRVQAVDSIVSGHTEFGIAADRIKLVRSSVTGSAPDLQAEHSPKLKDSVCDTSNGWGVCTND